MLVRPYPGVQRARRYGAIRNQEQAMGERRAGVSASVGHRAVLCLHSATLPPLGADTWVHQQILRNLDPATHSIFVACVTGPPGAPTPTYEALGGIAVTPTSVVR